MQMIHPLHAGAIRSLRGPATDTIEHRMVSSKARARQQHFFRSGVLLALTFVGIAILLVWRADTQRLRSARASMNGSLNALQARINELQGVLPGTIDADEMKDLTYFAGLPERFYAMRSGEPSIVAVSAQVSPFLMRSGRYIVFYDRGLLQVKWMTLGEYETAVQNQQEKMHALEQRLRSRPPELP